MQILSGLVLLTKFSRLDRWEYSRKYSRREDLQCLWRQLIDRLQQNVTLVKLVSVTDLQVN